MLGRLQRVSRVDVGLALAFAGVAYLVWALVAGIARSTVSYMLTYVVKDALPMPHLTQAVRLVFVDYGIFIDLVGLAWLVVSLLLVLSCSRQKMSISWAWISAFCQAATAALGAVLAGWGVCQPPILAIPAGRVLEKVRSISLGVVIAVAVFLWVAFLVWLLIQRAQFNRHGRSLRDGLRSNIFR